MSENPQNENNAQQPPINDQLQNPSVIPQPQRQNVQNVVEPKVEQAKQQMPEEVKEDNQEEMAAEAEQEQQEEEMIAEIEADQHEEIRQPEISLTYINSIENKLANVTQHCASLNSTVNNLNAQLNAANTNISTLKKEVFQTKGKLIRADKERQALRKTCEEMSQIIKAREQKLKGYEEAGDINLLKGEIEHLKSTIQIQKQEIQLLKLTKHESIEEESKKNQFSQCLQILDDQNQKIKSMALQIDSLNKSNEEKDQFAQMLKSQKEEAFNKIDFLMNRCSQMQEERELLKSKVNQAKLQQMSIQQNAQSIPQQIAQPIAPSLPFLTPSEQHSILLRQYISLEQQNQKLRFQISDLRKRLMEKSKDSKKQKVDIDVYRKMKVCLQGAFRKIEDLQAQIANQSRNSQLHQNNLKNQQISMVASSSQQLHPLLQSLSSQMNQMSSSTMNNALSLQLSSLQVENNELRKQADIARQSCQKWRELVDIWQSEVERRGKINQERQQIIQELKERLQRSNESKPQEEDFETLKTLNEIYQTKLLLLMKQNESLKAHAEHWNDLYQNMKQKHQQLLAFYSQQATQPISSLQMINPTALIPPSVQKDPIPSQPRQFSEQITQTDGLAEMHYKQIRQMLGSMRKIGKIMESVPQVIDKQGKTVVEMIGKYDQVFQKYNQKFASLRKQKSENDALRLRARDEIKEEFTQIRELISNNRMINALRKAKALIEYYEQQQKEREEQQKEEGQIQDVKEKEDEAQQQGLPEEAMKE